MNREILRIALPAIVANITIPLLGLLDTAIAGHLGSPSYIGAVAVGAMMFNMVYFGMGFLRMSTSGLTAQEYGRGDQSASSRVLRESCTIALVIGVVIIVLQWPLQWLLLKVIAPSSTVAGLSRRYFMLCVWGAPAVLLMMAIKGWLLGMQDSRSAMRISIMVNVVNTGISLVAVYVLDMGFIGIALGTLLSEYIGLVYSVLLVCRKYRANVRLLGVPWRWRLTVSRRYFTVSGDIFARSVLLALIHLAVTSLGARSGDLLLAVNSLMLQLNTFYAYFLDGIAFAGEALVGKYYGAGNAVRLRLCVRRLFVWATVLSLAFTLLYSFPQVIFGVLTSEQSVIEASMSYRWWCALLPIAGMAAFVWDGVFIGLTRSRGMLVAVAVATALFVVIYMTLPSSLGNHRLWLSFVSYLAARGLVQTVLYLKMRCSLSQEWGNSAE